MSVDVFLLLPDEHLPAISELQSAINLTEPGITLETIDNPREHTGFWPVNFKGQQSGFQWCYGRVQEVLGETPPWVGDYSYVVQFVFSSLMHELLSSLFVASALANLTHGRMYDEESDALIDSDKILQMARDIERDNL